MENTPTPRRRTRLGDFLLSKGIISPEQLEQGLIHQKKKGIFLGEAMISLGFITPAKLGTFMEELTTFPYVELATTPIDIHIFHLIPEQVARQNLVVAFAEQGKNVHVAMLNPLNLGLVDDLCARLQRRIVPFLAFKTDLEEAINRLYNMRHKGKIMLAEMDDDAGGEEGLTPDDLESLADQAPIVRLVHGIIESAIANKASDIHIEPQEENVGVRFRMDGLLHEQMTFSRQHLAAVISRIKVMSHLNIAERRRPQDGRFLYKTESGLDYDLRVSLMPLVHGESVVMRVLDKQMANLKLSNLGMDGPLAAQYRKLIRQPHGIILVTGPTGSGKTTSLYASLMEIASSDKKIMTVEDPVEYQLPGIHQVQIMPRIGVSFAESLRGIVRQDPDIILVGEIRDKETAEVAIQAALTGHLVLSTLHTNDAPGAIVRLQNMGVEPFLISSAVLGVVAQRLLRTVCSACKEVSPASEAMISAYGLPLIEGKPPLIATGSGCPRCNGQGMKGRIAVYELMVMSETLREMALKRCSGQQLRNQAIAEGMTTMKETALHKVAEGITTPREIARTLFSEDNWGEEPPAAPKLRAA